MVCFQAIFAWLGSGFGPVSAQCHGCETVPSTIFVPLSVLGYLGPRRVFKRVLAVCHFVLIVYRSHSQVFVLNVYRRRRLVAQCAQCVLAAAWRVLSS